MHGEQYFIGKTEDDLIKYFEEKGIELPNKAEYDKLVGRRRFFVCGRSNGIYANIFNAEQQKNDGSANDCCLNHGLTPKGFLPVKFE